MVSLNLKKKKRKTLYKTCVIDIPKTLALFTHLKCCLLFTFSKTVLFVNPS